MLDVQRSPIHGLGLFATEKIRKGKLIGRADGGQTTKDGPHVLWLNEQIGLKVQNELRFINHSPIPNAVYYDDATVVALRTIRKGEEITHDYTGKRAPWSAA